MSIDTEFLAARGQIAARITKLESELKYWREELSAFDRVETTMRRLNEGAKGPYGKFKLTPDPIPKTSPNGVGGFQLRVSEAVEMLNRQRGEVKKVVLETVKSSEGPISSKTVERAILKTGFKPKGKNFGITVYKTLKRLSEQKLIEKEENNGNVLFHAKP